MMSPSRIQRISLVMLAFLCACTGPATSQPVEIGAANPATGSAAAAMPAHAPAAADVLSVQISGNSGAYTFAVEIASPDENCSQYADWWEVIGEEGQLFYRRVLTHSHASEQPFSRSGGPVPVEPGTTIWVRAHMHSGGYGGAAMKGSVQTGFQRAELSANFAADLAELPPFPDDCAF